MPIRSIIVDTSAIYALVDANDSNHGAAVQYLRQVGNDAILVVTDYTLLETMTLLQVRLGKRIAARTLKGIMEGRRYRVIRLSEEDEVETWHVYEQFDEKNWTPFDCACLAAARLRGIKEAFAFDIHFDQMASAGLLRVPRR